VLLKQYSFDDVLRLKDAHLGGILNLGKLVGEKYKEYCGYNDSTRGHTGQDFFITFSLVNYFTKHEGAEIPESAVKMQCSPRRDITVRGELVEP